MIGRLRGTLVSRGAESVVLEVGGVGYEVLITPAGLAALPGVGEDIVLHTHLHVREDVLTLFGFVDEQQRAWFRILLGAPGVGPKVAQAVLATLEPDELLAAIAGEDVDALTLVPGIGKRSAQKMILELKPKVGAGEMMGSAEPTDATRVREALEQLGYTPAETKEILAEIDRSAPVPEQIRAALRALGAERHA